MGSNHSQTLDKIQDEHHRQQVHGRPARGALKHQGSNAGEGESRRQPVVNPFIQCLYLLIRQPGGFGLNQGNSQV